MNITVQQLLRLIQELEILERGHFTLAGGQQTAYYFDGRRLSLHPEGARLLGQAMLPIVREAGAQAIGGPATGALPLITALTLASVEDGGPPLPGFYTRPEAKGYGTGRLLEGCRPAEQPVAIVDDVCASGDALFQSLAAVEAAAGPVVKVLTLLDRQEGGGERLRQAGYDYAALFVTDAQGNITPAG